MKLNFIGLLLLFSMSSLMAQNPNQKNITGIQKEKSEILKEVEQIAETKAAMKKDAVLDSIVYYQYDENQDSVLSRKTEYVWLDGQDYQRFVYFWDVNLGSWINYLWYEYEFDEGGNITNYLRNTWDLDAMSWIPDANYVVTYNEAGLELLFIYLKWEQDVQDWQNYWKTEYEYTVDNLVATYTEWEPDDLTNEWVYFWKNEYEYTPSGELEVRIANMWDSQASDWNVEFKDEYTYDGNDYLVLLDSYNWNPIEDVWKHTFKYVYTNNSAGFPTFILSSYSNDNGATWTQQHKIEKSYDDANQQILHISYNWVSEDQDWIYAEKHEFQWDEYGNQILNSRHWWDEEILDWFLYNLTIREYNADGNILNVEEYAYNSYLDLFVGIYHNTYQLDENGDRLLVTSYSWDIDGEVWTLNEKGFYHYAGTIGQEENLALNVVCYPNPVTKNLFVNLSGEMNSDARYTIYTSTGQMIKQGKLPGFVNSLDLAGLQPGTYFLKVESGNRSGCQVILKQ